MPDTPTDAAAIEQRLNEIADEQQYLDDMSGAWIDLEDERLAILFGESRPDPEPEPSPEPQPVARKQARSFEELGAQLREMQDHAVDVKAEFETAKEAMAKLPPGSARRAQAEREVAKMEQDAMVAGAQVIAFKQAEDVRLGKELIRKDLIQKTAVRTWRETALSAQRLLIAERAKRQAAREPFSEIEVELEKVQRALTEQPSAHFRAEVAKKIDAEIAAAIAKSQADRDRIEQAIAAGD